VASTPRGPLPSPRHRTSRGACCGRAVLHREWRSPQAPRAAATLARWGGRLAVPGGSTRTSSTATCSPPGTTTGSIVSSGRIGARLRHATPSSRRATSVATKHRAVAPGWTAGGTGQRRVSRRLRDPKSSVTRLHRGANYP
jgi:hypothetical protein